MKVKFTNIVWDDERSGVELPSEYITVVDDDIDLDTEGADILSDEFGWCVFSFDFVIIC